MSTIDPTYSNKIVLSDSLKASLSGMGVNVSTFDDLVLHIISNVPTQQDLQDVKDQISNISADTLPAAAQSFGLKTGSVDAASLTTKHVNYSVGTSDLTVSYQTLKDNLPSGMQLVKATTTVISDSGARSSLTGTSAVIKMPDNPVQVQFKADVQTANGLLQLTRTVPVSTGTFAQVLDVNDLTTSATNLSVSGFLTLLAGEIAKSKS